jgi:hypothetical protein
MTSKYLIGPDNMSDLSQRIVWLTHSNTRYKVGQTLTTSLQLESDTQRSFIINTHIFFV